MIVCNQQSWISNFVGSYIVMKPLIKCDTLIITFSFLNGGSGNDLVFASSVGSSQCVGKQFQYIK